MTPGPVLLIDSHSVLFRAHWALPAMSTAAGEPTAALYGTCALLLKLNTRLRFGAFAYAEGKQLILLTHSLLGGETLDPPEITATIADLAHLADDHDDDIIARYGGQRMADLLEASQIGKLFKA